MSVVFGELRRNQEMDSTNSGVLMRYSSAPSSLLASLIDNNNQNCVNNEEPFTSEDHHHHDNQSYLPPTSLEMDTMLSKLVSSNDGWSNSEPLQEFGGKHVKQEAGEFVKSQQNGYSYGGSELIYQGLPNGSIPTSNGFYSSFGVVNSLASENITQSTIGVRNSSNLIRQRSSPAGFFSNENGLATLREVGSFKASNVSNEQATFTFSSRQPSCLKRMPQIAEKRRERLEESCDQSRNLVNGSSKSHIPSLTSEFWDNSAFNSLKIGSEDEIMFSTTNGLESQEAEFCYQNLGLTHHLSLPSSSTKMTSIEKFLQVQGTVPCKIRAKRGFATHPRSIAERVRRTRISERIKKLDGLFPKSDKQASTADMLDVAVEYIKDLQEQVKILKDRREKCRCT